jgi:hypothetical protein
VFDLRSHVCTHTQHLRHSMVGSVLPGWAYITSESSHPPPLFCRVSSSLRPSRASRAEPLGVIRQVWPLLCTLAARIAPGGWGIQTVTLRRPAVFQAFIDGLAQVRRVVVNRAIPSGPSSQRVTRRHHSRPTETTRRPFTEPYYVHRSPVEGVLLDGS